MKDTILNFIDRFSNSGTVETFNNGCCYWFARILNLRFPSSSILYNPVENHFAVLIEDSLYDINGEVKRGKGWVNWELYQIREPSDTLRLYKNCINF